MKTIEVMANPYTAVDKDGFPQGTVCPPGSPTTHIGALVDQTLSARLGRERFYYPLGATKGVFKIPLTAEIARSVREGELIAADERSARLAGVPAGKFLDPEVALSREKERAEALFHANAPDDPDEPRELQEVPREPVERMPEDDMTDAARRHRQVSGVVIAEPAKLENSKKESV